MAAAPTPPAQPGGVEVAPGIFVPRSALRFAYTRSGGPGGQHVNKVATRAQCRLALAGLEPQLGPAAIRRLIRLAGAVRVTETGDLLLVADESRSQRANRRACLERLSALIVEAIKPPRTRKKTRPTKAARQRRIEQKKRRSQVKRARRRPDVDG